MSREEKRELVEYEYEPEREVPILCEIYYNSYGVWSKEATVRATKRRAVIEMPHAYHPLYPFGDAPKKISFAGSEEGVVDWLARRLRKAFAPEAKGLYRVEFFCHELRDKFLGTVRRVAEEEQRTKG